MAKVKNLFVREQMMDDGWAMTTVVGQRGRVHETPLGAKSAARICPSAKCFESEIFAHAHCIRGLK